MNLPCIVLPYELNDGPAQMALDEALLEHVADRPEAAYLRTYQWRQPTLSLGYFQHLGEVEAEPRWRSVPLVRRPTGGGAIWHRHELTYALVTPARSARAQPHSALYRAVHAMFLAGLRDHGLPAERRGQDGRRPDVPAAQPGQRPFLCFTDRDADDIVSAGFKIVGSAQRRRAGAILQHGSLLLRSCPRTPELRGACELADVPSDPLVWTRWLQEHLEASLELSPDSREWPSSVRRRAGELEQSVYRNPSWTARRP